MLPYLQTTHNSKNLLVFHLLYKLYNRRRLMYYCKLRQFDNKNRILL